MQNCGIFQLHFTLVLQVSPPAPDPAGSCLRAPGLRGPVSFRLFVLYNFHTFVQLLPPKCATHLPRLFHLEEQHLHRTRLPVCLPASHAHRPQPPPLVLALNCILLPQIQMRKCVCVRDPCIHDIHARFCAFNAKL